MTAESPGIADAPSLACFSVRQRPSAGARRAIKTSNFGTHPALKIHSYSCCPRRISSRTIGAKRGCCGEHSHCRGGASGSHLRDLVCLLPAFQSPEGISCCAPDGSSLRRPRTSHRNRVVESNATESSPSLLGSLV